MTRLRSTITIGLLLSTTAIIAPAIAAEHEEEQLVCMAPETYGVIYAAALDKPRPETDGVEIAETTWLVDCLEYGGGTLEECIYQYIYDDCMENGYVVINGDVVEWFPPSEEECFERAEIGWWTGELLTEHCRQMGENKKTECLAQFDDPETSSEHLEQENYCDASAVACGRGCMLGNMSDC